VKRPLPTLKIMQFTQKSYFTPALMLPNLAVLVIFFLKNQEAKASSHLM
jgi:hypothetical protein